MPECSALNNAIKEKGLKHSQLAQSTRIPEQRIKDICAGTAQPTTQEFNALVSALGIPNLPFHASVTR